MANLYTKTGDGGTTALAGGSRVKKDSPQVWCYGTVDEANAFLGMAYALSQEDFLSQNIDAIQHKLFLLAAELACDERGKERLGENVIQEEDVELDDGSGKMIPVKQYKFT